ncbi:MAG: hypothetical protein HC846_09340 [Blastocatellia bacterium]|nr:hypothetical protein [Blastocatellia bacterium]
MNADTKSTHHFKNRWRHSRKRTAKSTTTSISPAAEATPEEKAVFIRNSYLHLAIAIGIFVVLEAFFVWFRNITKNDGRICCVGKRIYFRLSGFSSFLCNFLLLRQTADGI